MKSEEMNLPEELKYTKEHQWVKQDGDYLISGITDFAQSELGDIVYIDIESLDEEVDVDAVYGSIEAVKTVSDLFLAVSGEIVEFNEELEVEPELVNKDPYGKGWIIKIKPQDINDMSLLLNAKDYQELVAAK